MSGETLELIYLKMYETEYRGCREMECYTLEVLFAIKIF